MAQLIFKAFTLQTVLQEQLLTFKNQKIMETKNMLTFGAIVATMLFVSSCKKETMVAGQESTATATSQPAGNTMRVKMTDGPGNYQALNVNIVAVEVYKQDSGWISLNNSAQTVSVLDLTNGTSTQLGYSSNISAGVYTKLRLKFGAQNTLTLNAQSATLLGVSAMVDLQWDAAKEVEIAINEEVNAHVGAEILIDFEVANSIKENLGTYVIHPVIRNIEDEETGVRGQIEASAHAALIVTSPEGELSSYTDASGNFMLQGLRPGEYTIKVMSTAEQIKNGMPSERTISGVVVVEGKITQAGIIRFS